MMMTDDEIERGFKWLDPDKALAIAERIAGDRAGVVFSDLNINRPLRVVNCSYAVARQVCREISLEITRLEYPDLPSEEIERLAFDRQSFDSAFVACWLTTRNPLLRKTVAS